jgi:putrescine aminotransferase
MSDSTLSALDRAHYFHPFTDLTTHNRQGGAIYRKAEHIYVYNERGDQVLDGMSGLWCCNLGYSQPEINDSISDQLAVLPYYNSFFQCTNDVAVSLAKALTAIAPEGFKHVFFTNSGSEANDTNIRLVHRYYELLDKPQKKIIISRKNAYHGSTIAAGCLGGFKHMHAQLTPLEYVHHIEQPHWYEVGGELTPEEFGVQAARALEAKIHALGEQNVAAFIAEPIQGAGGVIVPPSTYWPEIKRICEAHDILLISDEVICGFGRTGRWFGAETYDVQPDLITFAKAVTNGYQPLGGVLISEKVGTVLTSGGGELSHGFTYSGHPVACAAALATINIYRRDNIIEHAAQNIMPYFQRKWAELIDHPIVGQVRGKGMLAALELVRDKAARTRLAPQGQGASTCRDFAISSGLMIRAVGNSIISAPPLVCTTAEIDLLVDLLVKALDKTARQYQVQ